GASSYCTALYLNFVSEYVLINNQQKDYIVLIQWKLMSFYGQQVILEHLSRLTQEQFASRGVQYDRISCFRAENFETLFNIRSSYSGCPH
ncbi:MAG: hypothetical protein O4803_12930, partial [Trichodesmium sp. St15_bin1_1]|nr:hypothetical protein [Trichodesmium sp. St15_bin1_1]